MGCVHKYRSNCWEVPAQLLDQELFEPLLHRQAVRIERIVSMGPETLSFQWDEQSWDEWVVLLQGEAVLEQESGKKIALRSGEMVWIPAGCRHRVIDVSAEPPAIWLAVHIRPEE